MMNGAHDTTPRPVADVVRFSWEGIEERFWTRVDRAAGEGSCWEWLSEKDNRSGYGTFNKVRAHRLAYYLATGIDPGRLFVCHHCDNPPCVRPSHLFLGTAADNHDDMKKKGRGKSGFKRTLSAEETEKVLLLWAEGEFKHSELAERFGVSRATIGRMVSSVKSRRQLAGLHSGREKLTEQQVVEIRARYARGGISQRALGAQYGVTGSLVHCIVAGKTRPDIGGDQH